MILLVSHEGDDHAVAVRDDLGHRHPHVPVEVLDLATFPSEASLHMTWDGPEQPWQASVTVDGRTLDLTDVRVAWWRRPQPFVFAAELTDPVARRFAHAETAQAVTGLLSSLPATWINDPNRDDEAGHKPYQLTVARAVGLLTPRTVITNDPAGARSFAQRIGVERTIYKTFTATEDAWRETRVLRDEELALLDDVRFAPVIFQEFVPASADIRVTVVGERMFAAAITTRPGGYLADHRAELDDATIEPHELPVVVADSLRRLMDRLGLVYGAIDLRLTPSGTYVFLEVNPSGQWRYLSDRTEQPVTEAFADLLVALHAREPAT